MLVHSRTGENAVTKEDGLELFNQLLPLLEKGEEIILDFDGVKVLATPFMNHSLGRLMSKYGIEGFDSKIKLERLSQAGGLILSRVRKNVASGVNDLDIESELESLLSER
jgi:hypothetical protein